MEELSLEKLNEYKEYFIKKHIEEIEENRKNIKNITSKIGRRRKSLEKVDKSDSEKISKYTDEINELTNECESIKNVNKEKNEELKDFQDSVSKIQKLIKSNEDDKKEYEKFKSELSDEDKEDRNKLIALYAREKQIKQNEEEISKLAEEFYKKHFDEFIDFSYKSDIDEINSKIDELSSDEENKEELDYYKSKLSKIEEIKENKKVYYSTKFSEEISKEERVEKLDLIKEKDEELNNDLKELDEEINNRDEKGSTPKVGFKNDPLEQEDSSLYINKVHSNKLNSVYDDIINKYTGRKEELESRKTEIENEFSEREIDITLLDDVSSLDDYLIELKDEYDRINEEIVGYDEKISTLEPFKIEIAKIENFENEIIDIQKKIDALEEQINEEIKNLDDETIPDDEKDNLKMSIFTLKNERNALITEIRDIKDKEQKFYYDLKDKLKEKEDKSKHDKNNSKKKNNDEFYYYIPKENETPSIEENIPSSVVSANEPQEEKENKEKDENKEENSIVETNTNIIDLYIKNGEKDDKVFYNKDFDVFVKALKEATVKNRLTKAQKLGLKRVLDKKNNSISDNIKNVKNVELLNGVIREIYGKDNYDELSNYTSLNGNLDTILKNEIFDDIYKFNGSNLENVLVKINDINNMDDKTVNFLNAMFTKYQEGLESGRIVEGDKAYTEFNKLIVEPLKVQIVNSYNKEIQKPFIFRKLSGIFNSKKISKLDKFKDLVVNSTKVVDNKNNKLDLSSEVKSDKEINERDINAQVVERTVEEVSKDVQGETR